MSEAGEPSAPVRRAGKSAAAFRTISEVAAELEVPAHVLRFWETKFPSIKPLKRGGGRRYYRPEDVELLRRIRGLLYQQGYTIKGAQKLLREGHARPGAPAAAELPLPEPPPRETNGEDEAPPGLGPSEREALDEVLGELKQLRALLDRHTRPT